MASVTTRPDKFIGTHFFNPVPVMKLLEIIRGYETSEQTLRLALEWGKKIGKDCIVVKEAPAFVVNRVLCSMINEAFFVLGEGLASAAETSTRATCSGATTLSDPWPWPTSWGWRRSCTSSKACTRSSETSTGRRPCWSSSSGQAATAGRRGKGVFLYKG